MGWDGMGCVMTYSQGYVGGPGFQLFLAKWTQDLLSHRFAPRIMGKAGLRYFLMSLQARLRCKSLLHLA